ncbi:MAG TPA: hypothetical protein VHD15_13265 [Hyphomicrobiales bacterium]|nr:hypothetical protein [Hyphomicrobiales bacterium]
MAAQDKDFRDLLGAVEHQLAASFALYERVRRLASLPETLQSRTLELFRRDGDAGAEVRLEPYAKVTPHAAFGFEQGLAATLAWRDRTVPAGFAEEFGHAVEITIADGGGSRWFALEIDAPWWEIRRAAALSVVAAARFDGDFRASLEVFVWDHAGTRHTIASRAFLFEAAASTLQLNLPIAIPPEIVLDESREPRVALFLPRDPTRLTLDHLWLRLHPAA